MLRNLSLVNMLLNVEIKISLNTLQEKADDLFKIRESVKKQYDAGYSVIEYSKDGYKDGN